MSPAVKYGAAAVALIAAIFGWRWYANKYGIASRFDAVYEQYALTDFKPSDATLKEGDPLYRTGKVFVVHRGTSVPAQMSYRPGWIDAAWYALDSSLRATRPEEVDTLVVTSTAAFTTSTGTGYREEAGDFVIIHQTSYSSTSEPAIQLEVYDLKRQTKIGLVRIAVQDPTDLPPVFGPVSMRVR